MRLALLILLFSAAFSLEVIAADPPTQLSPDQPYSAQRSEPVTYRVDFSAVVTAPYKAKQLRVWLPIPPSDVGQELRDSKLSTFPLDVKPTIATEPLYGNKFAYFEFDEPQGAQIIRHQFTIKVWQLNWELEAPRIQPVESWPTAFQPYRRSETQAVVVDNRFEQLLEQIVPERKNPLSDLSTVMTWVNKNFQYDHDHASLQADATHALTEQRGHCSDYHGFCASLGRAMGYPTRVTYGINPFPKSSPSHCKLEAFLPPYGWVSFDVSETQKLSKEILASEKLTAEEKSDLTAAAQRRLISGFRDNTWFLQTKGTDYDLAPATSRRVAVVRTIYAEADGQPLPEPDPANRQQREFSWMTVHKYEPDRQVAYPFSDLSTLKPYLKVD
jgi:transglutaminase-like putative cysteine protease